MAQPFTNEQRDAIRRRLFESAQRHAIAVGPLKTSLDTLTSEAGISKSSFYKFYENKEQLFLEVALSWEGQIIGAAMRSLEHSIGRSSKERASAFVYTAFETMHQLGVVRFMRDDLPYLSAFIPGEEAKAHTLNSARTIFESLRGAGIRFTQPDELVLSVIQLMYMSILNIREIGSGFFPALHTLVASACDRLVA